MPQLPDFSWQRVVVAVFGYGPNGCGKFRKVPVPENAAALVNGAWYNLFDYSSTYANIGYRALQCLDDMMASDIVSRPKYGFNSSYQFNDIALPSNNRTEFAWYLIYKRSITVILPFPFREIRRSSGRRRDRHWRCVLSVIYTWCSIINSLI